MKDFYGYLDISKQSFHQMLIRKRCKQEETEQIIHLVRQVRKDHPRMSARDIYKMVKPSFIGRDQFEQICYENGLGVKKKKSFKKTTDSTGVTRFPNHLAEIEVTGVNQVFVSDITYYEMNNQFYYLTFIMDLYNREIVGYGVSINMRTESTTLPALDMVTKLRGSENIKGAIFHSDGGGQYYSTDFVSLTADLELVNSMTEVVYDNSHAERLNGIIKNNYLYPYGPKDYRSLKRSLKKAVWMYNNEKPHSSLKGETPVKYRKAIENQVNAI